ncbi:ABC transporter ATP-binding protein [Sphingobacterium sp. UT-1RO-CII-1]|uniref:ABC transporter ATP-binding protein n=1 Tax=Sphingobacterium sp. UT-1RO-CII-1 TaxID=2995225 RepID=UPI00227A8EE6|nr:ABC transporter ATP-binding protein [Sphingobacterium sp. UT-1RO-CII-1]MCY4780998.1 ABC transporter ATP-binding protein [Sphingobacterium sp. UT-1RO-CII-1]
MVNNLSSCSYSHSSTQTQQGLAMIDGKQVSLFFQAKDQIIAVDNVSFEIQQGKTTAIIGESGSGKSTLLKLIYGLLEPNKGEIRYKGSIVPTRKDKLIPGHDAMKLVSQGFDDLNLYANVWDNVSSQLPNTNINLKHTKTQETLERLKIAHLAKQRIADLSGGEKQRVAIARALINKPEVLLMDEPFNQVDAAFRDALQQDISQIVEETGLTIILVSHDPTEVLAMSDELIVMKDAKIIEQGKPNTLYHQPKNAYTALLLAKSNIINAKQAKSISITTQQRIAIHQENIQFQIDPQGEFTLKNIRFRGFYNELIISNNIIDLHLIQFPPFSTTLGIKGHIQISKYIEVQV